MSAFIASGQAFIELQLKILAQNVEAAVMLRPSQQALLCALQLSWSWCTCRCMMQQHSALMWTGRVEEAHIFANAMSYLTVRQHQSCWTPGCCITSSEETLLEGLLCQNSLSEPAQSLAVMQMSAAHDQPSSSAALANCCEIQSTPEHLSAAVELRARASLLPESAIPSAGSTCYICLKELQMQLPSEACSLMITLPTCLHSFHLKCLGEWRCSSMACPECRKTLSQALDQMLLAGTFLHGQDTTLGNMCTRIREKVQGAQDHLRRRAENVGRIEAEMLHR